MPDMAIQLEMMEGNSIKGFHLETGKRLYNSGRQIQFEGSYDGVSWNKIGYSFGSPYDYMFDSTCDYRF